MVHNFSFSSVDFLIDQLETLISMSHKNMAVVAEFGAAAVRSSPKDQKATSQAVDCVAYIVKATPNLLGWLRCGHIDDGAKRLAYWPEREDKSWSELNTRARALRDAIDTELKEYLFYQYPKDKGVILKRWNDDWQKVFSAFPDTAFEAFSAIDCYALQHHTASVFHSMRIAEHGMRALAKERRIRLPKNKPLEWGTWQEIIRALDEQIKLIGMKRAGKSKDAALEFYSGARADLNGFKDEYRNAVMHVRERYDEFQALRALTKVHAFMERLASKIDQKSQRIT